MVVLVTLVVVFAVFFPIAPVVALPLLSLWFSNRNFNPRRLEQITATCCARTYSERPWAPLDSSGFPWVAVGSKMTRSDKHIFDNSTSLQPSNDVFFLFLEIRSLKFCLLFDS